MSALAADIKHCLCWG